MSIYAGYGASEYAKSTGSTIKIQSTVRSQTVEFPAFLTDFSQTFASEWNAEAVYARNDPIATFQGTKRTITLAWDIPSATVADAKKNLQNCNLLAKFMYPGYSNGIKAPQKDKTKDPKVQALNAKNKKSTRFDTNLISRPPLVRVSFANLIAGASSGGSLKSKVEKEKGKDKPTTGNKEETEAQLTTSGVVAGTGLLGYITSLNWKPALDMGMFTSGKKLYPKVISVSMDLNVLHEHFLGWDSGGWMGEGNELFRT